MDHTVTMINHPDGYTLLTTEILVLPDDSANPYWNDCFTNVSELHTESKEVLNIIDYLCRELSVGQDIYNQPFMIIYTDGSIDKRLKIK